jgi:predicted RND superfamily exporter protein
MTSTAMIAGALPPALAVGPGAELQRPMAIAMVGGIAVSTLLTLFVVPAAYSVIDDVVVWNAERRKSGEGLLSGLATAWSRRRRASSLEAS